MVQVIRRKRPGPSENQANQIENYFPNIELFFFLQFTPVVEMGKMFEDLHVSLLYRQK